MGGLLANRELIILKNNKMEFNLTKVTIDISEYEIIKQLDDVDIIDAIFENDLIDDVLDNLDSEILFQKVTSNENSLIEHLEEKDLVVRKENIKGSDHLYGDNFKRYLCDMAGVGYHTDVDSIFANLKKRL